MSRIAMWFLPSGCSLLKSGLPGIDMGLSFISGCSYSMKQVLEEIKSLLPLETFTRLGKAAFFTKPFTLLWTALILLHVTGLYKVILGVGGIGDFLIL